MEPASYLLELARDLQGTAEAIQRALLDRNVAALPGLVEREQSLAERLNRELSRRAAADEQPGGQGPTELPGELQALLRGWWRTHEQNRLLLQQAHRTVVELIGLLAGCAGEPVGLYSPGADGRAAARIDRRA